MHFCKIMIWTFSFLDEESFTTILPYVMYYLNLLNFVYNIKEIYFDIQVLPGFFQADTKSESTSLNILFLQT